MLMLIALQWDILMLLVCWERPDGGKGQPVLAVYKYEL